MPGTTLAFRWLSALAVTTKPSAAAIARRAARARPGADARQAKVGACNLFDAGLTSHGAGIDGSGIGGTCGAGWAAWKYRLPIAVETAFRMLAAGSNSASLQDTS